MRNNSVEFEKKSLEGVRRSTFKTFCQQVQDTKRISILINAKTHQGSPDDCSSSSSRVSEKYIPMNKADDFGHHCNRYYQLEISYYMSTMDTKLLKYFWNSYWVQTLSGNKLGGISGYLNSQLSNLDSILQGINQDSRKNERAGPLLSKCGDDSRKMVTEASNGLIQEFFKRSFCDGVLPVDSTKPEAGASEPVNENAENA